MFAILTTTALLNLPTTIILARTLNPAGYGDLQFILRLAFIIVSIAQLGLPYALTAAMTRSHDPRAQADVYRVALTTSLFTGALAAIGLTCYALVAGDRHEAAIWYVLALYPMANLLSAAVAAAARGAGNLRAVAVIRLSQVVVYTFTIGVLAVMSELTLFRCVVAFTGCQVLSAITAAGVLVRNRPGRHLDESGIRPASQPVIDRSRIYAFARRVYLGHTVWSWNVYLDQLILGFILSRSELGYYAIAAGLTLSLSLISTPISTSAQPAVQIAAPHERVQRVQRLLAATILAVGSAALLLALTAPILVDQILGRQFSAAIPVVQILSLAALLNGINACLYGVLLGLDAPTESSKAATLGLIVNVIGWVAIVPTQAAPGAAWVSVVAYGAVTAYMTRAVLRRTQPNRAPTFFAGVARTMISEPRRMLAIVYRIRGRVS